VCQSLTRFGMVVQGTVTVTADALDRIINVYDRMEPGVGLLRRTIEKVYRGCLLTLARQGYRRGAPSASSTPAVVVTADSLRDLLGVPPLVYETIYAHNTALPPGVVMGLAAGHGGTVCYIETALHPRAYAPEPHGASDSSASNASVDSNVDIPAKKGRKRAAPKVISTKEAVQAAGALFGGVTGRLGGLGSF